MRDIDIPSFDEDVLEDLRKIAQGEGVPPTNSAIIRWACAQFVKAWKQEHEARGEGAMENTSKPESGTNPVSGTVAIGE